MATPSANRRCPLLAKNFTSKKLLGFCINLPPEVLKIFLTKVIFLKSLKSFFPTHCWTVLNLGPASLADVCAAKTYTNIQISLSTGYKKIIRRF